MALQDRAGDRPVMEQRIPGAEVPSWLELWAQIHADLAELERAAGVPAPPTPKEVTVDQVEAIATVASILRTRRHVGRASSISMTIAEPTASSVSGVIGDLEIRHTLVANVFGQEMPVAREIIAMPPMVVRERVSTDDGWKLTLVPLVGAEVEVVAELVPLAESPE